MKKVDAITLIISLIAIIISGVSFYIQFFYENQSINITFIDTTISYTTNKISSKILYHNKGNMYSTITQNYFIFYQENDTIATINNNNIELNTLEDGKQFIETYDATVLKPGEQILKDIEQSVVFEKTNNINYNKEIQVAIYIAFINSEGRNTSETINIGSLKLIRSNTIKIKEYNFRYNTKELVGNTYLSSIKGIHDIE